MKAPEISTALFFMSSFCSDFRMSYRWRKQTETKPTLITAVIQWKTAHRERSTRMKRFLLVVIASMALTTNSVNFLTAKAAPGGSCADTPLRVIIFNNAIVDPASGATTPSAIRPDSGGEYVNGGTTSASIKCGTNDAVLNLATSRRTF